MKKKNTIILFILLVLLVLGIIFVFKLGAYYTYTNSKNNNFVGIVDFNIHINNSSEKEMNGNDARGIWHFYINQVPGPAVLIGGLITRRIEIIDFKMSDGCGYFDANFYTFFNIKYMKSGKRVHCS